MKKSILLLTLFSLLSSLAFSEKLRVMIETDSPGGDPDDDASLVRFFTYVNEWDVEGILCTRKASQSSTGQDGKTSVLGFVSAYEKVYPKLKENDKNYPTPENLRKVVKASSEAKDLIISAVDKSDPRPLWYANWGTNDGNTTGMKFALDQIKSTRSAADYKKFMARICFSRDGSRHIGDHANELRMWVNTRDPDKWYHRFGPLTATAGGFNIDRDVKKDHGPLGAKYTIQKEGDTPSILYWIPTGMNDVNNPGWGSWAGRFAPMSSPKGPGFWESNATDTWKGSTNRDNTLKRWAEHIQNDFAARMDWQVKSYADANHAPEPVVNGKTGMDVIDMRVSAGQKITLSAAGSKDPDGNTLKYEWVSYPEPGNYKKLMTIENAGSENASVQIPSDFKNNDTAHVVLIATDSGKPALTRYRRVLLIGGTSTQVKATRPTRSQRIQGALPMEWNALGKKQLNTSVVP